jgi:hypothetical protein
MMSTCDKCGLPVASNNNSVTLDVLTGDMSEVTALLATPRHFLPIKNDDDEVLCVGSPSRAQYLEGQPRDTRGYPYNEEREATIREAYAQMLVQNPVQ